MSNHAAALDADTKALLFLCCSNHVVVCAHCRTGLKIRMLRRGGGDADAYACPRCDADVTGAVVAHTDTCRYFAKKKPAVKITRDERDSTQRKTA